jgi:hypothetical protein
MRSFPVGLLLLSLAACSEPATEPTTTTSAPPSFSTTQTSATVDFEGTSFACGTGAGSFGTAFAPLAFSTGWLFTGGACGLIHTGTGAVGTQLVTPFLATGLYYSGFSLPAPVRTITFWIRSEATPYVTIRAVDVNGDVTDLADGPALGIPSTGTSWVQATVAAPFDVNAFAGVLFVSSLPGPWVFIDDVVLTSVSEAPVPAFAGFFQPVDNNGILNIAKAGSTIPVKFSLGGDFGLDVLLKVPTASAIACPTGTGADAIEEVATTPSGLTYDAATGQYIYAWKTQSAWKGTCKQLHMPLSDGIDHTALFQFK